jgi:PTS system mannose-specific IIC component
MMAMIKKVEYWLFLVLGFVLASYLKLAVLPITLIALVIAYLYDLATTRPVVATEGPQSFSEEDYDI